MKCRDRRGCRGQFLCAAAPRQEPRQSQECNQKGRSPRRRKASVFGENAASATTSPSPGVRRPASARTMLPSKTILLMWNMKTSAASIVSCIMKSLPPQGLLPEYWLYSAAYPDRNEAGDLLKASSLRGACLSCRRDFALVSSVSTYQCLVTSLCCFATGRCFASDCLVNGRMEG